MSPTVPPGPGCKEYSEQSDWTVICTGGQPTALPSNKSITLIEVHSSKEQLRLSRIVQLPDFNQIGDGTAVVLMARCPLITIMAVTLL
jgi:hypothetical protein